MTHPQEIEHRWVLDSLEEGIATVEEDGARMLRVPRSLLPEAVREGDVLRVTRSGGDAGARLSLVVAIDRGATAQAMARSREQTRGSVPRSHDPGGDIVL